MKKINILLLLSLILSSCGSNENTSLDNESISSKTSEISSTNKVENEKYLIDSSDILNIKKMYKVLYNIDKKGNIEIEGEDITLSNTKLQFYYNVDKDYYELRAYPINGYDIDDLFINETKYKYDSLQYVYDNDNPYYLLELDENIAIDGLKVRINSSLYKDANYLKNDESLANLLKGLNYSIMGDSISTFEGYNNNTSFNSTLADNAVYYPCSSYSVSNQVLEVSDTYWYMIKEDLGFNLCVNNAYSGSHVTQIYSNAQSACLSRCLNMHNDITNVLPDIITVYIGINDHGENKELGTFESRDDIYDEASKQYKTATASKYFKSAYAMMIDKMVNAYPKAKIYVSNLLVSNYHKSSKELDLLDKYNEAIKDIASFYHINFVDMVSYSGISKDLNFKYYEDSMIHPNTLGMERMKNVFENAIIKDFAYEENL